MLWLVLGCALLVRLLAFVAAADARPVLDEELYLQRAAGLLDGRGFLGSWQSWVRHADQPMMAALPQYPGSYQPPLYALYVAATLSLGGRAVWAVKLGQIVLGTLTVGLVYSIGRSWLGERRALVAAAVLALYPTLVAFTHYIWSETLFIFLLTAAIRLLTRDRELPSWRLATAAGALLGLGILTRGVLLYFLPLLLLWLGWTHRGRGQVAWRRAAGVLAVALIVVSPWSVRSSVLHGGLVVLDTNGPFNLWRGNTPDAYTDRADPPGGTYAAPFRGIPLMPVARQSPRRLVETVRRETGVERPTDLEIARVASHLARRDILDAPGRFLARVPVKLVDLWNPTSFLLRQFRIGAYADASPTVEAAVSWAAVLSYIGVMAFGLWGAIALRRDPRTQLVLLLVLFVTVVHGVTFGLTRFRLPVMPFVIVLAAHAMVTAFDGLRGKRPPILDTDGKKR